MSGPSTAFVTYLWHYVVARLLYDDLVRPLMGGGRAALMAIVGIAAALVLVLVLLRLRRSRS
jgi:hypothetical protein